LKEDPVTTSLVSIVLARPQELVARDDDPAMLATLAPPLLSIAVGGSCLFGLVVGTFHGGWQPLFAALKMPLVLLVPVLVTLPALRVLHAGLGEPVPTQRAALAALVGMARVAVLASALAPLLWLALSLGPSYPTAFLLMCGALVAAGLPGLVTIARCLAPGARLRPLALLATLGLVGVVIAQSGWLLRPFVVTPGAPLTVLCPVSQDVFTGLLTRVMPGAAPVDAAVECAS
jgi:hypothetical protein